MITAKHLNELLGFRAPMSAVVSAYLEVGSPGLYRVSFENLARPRAQEAKNGPDLAADFDQVRRYLEEEFQPDGYRGVAVFSSRRFGLWRAVPLLQPVTNRLRVDSAPYLPPLVNQTDQHLRYGVVLVTPRRARFMESFMGQIQEYPDMALDSGTGGEGHEYLKAITDKVDGLARNQGYQRVILGVEPSLSLALVNHLHTHLQHNLILDADLDPASASPQVLARIMACEAEARRVRESVLAHRLVDAAHRGSLAVLGLERTLAALQRGRVLMLLVRDGLAKMGRACADCGWLSLAEPRCGSCGKPMAAVFNIVPEIVDKALSQRAEVVRLFHDTPLDNLGRIGAELSCEADPPTPPARSAQVPQPRPEEARVL